METYVAIFEEILASLGLSVTHVTLGIIAFCVLTTLLAVLGSGRKAGKLATALAKARADHDLTRAQLTENAQTAQSQIQQLEAQLQLKNADLEQQKQALQSQTDRVQTLQQHINQRSQDLRLLLTSLEQDFALQPAETADINSLEEAALWQRHSAVIADLANSLRAAKQQLLTLQAKSRSCKVHTDKLEVGRMQVFNDLNMATQKIRYLETSLNNKLLEEQNKAATKLHAYKADIDKLELDRMQVFNDLNLAVQKIRQLETTLKNKEQQIEAKKQEPIEQKKATPAPEPEEKPKGRPTDEPAEEIKQAQPLLVEAINNLGLGKQQLPEDSNKEIKEERQHQEKPAEPIKTEPTEETRQPNALFARVVNTLGLGKKQLPPEDNSEEIKKERAQETQESLREETPAEPTATEPKEEARQPNALFARVVNTLGLGKQQPTEDNSPEVKQEPQHEDKPAIAIEPMAAIQQPKPSSFAKMISSLGLSKQAPIKEDEPEATQGAAEQQPASHDEMAENPQDITKQLKSFYQKMTFSKKN